jgi:ABC-type oligopeptide transport system substrate-binding subunit/class 3 adenylate cyclase
MAELPAGTVTFLFTDIAGSTRLLQQLGADRYRQMLAAHRALLRAAFKKYHGREIDTQGDAFFVSFRRASEAAAAVVEMQRALAGTNWPEGVEVRVRMGLHTGEPLVGEDGYVGMDVHRAARIAHVGHGGQVLLSEATAILLKRDLPEGATLKDLGEYQLKNLRTTWRIYQLVIPDLATEFPALKAKLIKPPAEPVVSKSVPQPAFLEALEDEPTQPPFVARERELEQLDAFLVEVLAGQGQVVFLTGGPGRGKTVLLQAFARRAMAHHPELLAATGGCNAYTGAGDPYLPFRDMLTMLTGDVESRWAAGEITTAQARRTWEAMAEVTQVLIETGPNLINEFVPAQALLGRAAAAAAAGAPWLPALRDLVEGAGRAHPELDQARLFGQVEALLRAVSQEQPLLITLDDLQWADAASLNLLFHLGRRLAGDRILILGAYRPEEVALGRGGGRHPLEKVVGEFKRQYGEVVIDLREDEAGDVAFVEALLDTEANRLPAAFREALFRKTQGHPLFTVELLRDLQERGALMQDEEGNWIVGMDLDWEVLPARVEGVIEERIGRLEAELREILTVASVEGEDFTAQVVARVQDLKERGLLRRLNGELDRQHRLIQERGQQTVENQRLYQYRFRHTLFQQHLYNGLAAGERELLHAEVGGVLEELYGDDAEAIAPQLAWHFTEAREGARAVPYCLQAGDRARNLFAHQEAAHFYEQALAHQKSSGQLEAAASTLMCLGLTHQMGFDFGRARRAFEESFALRRKALSVPLADVVPAPHPLRFFSAEPVELDPSVQNDRVSGELIQQLFSGLVRAGPNWTIEPEVARSWEISGDGRRYLFHLREDVVWTDGEPVTAHDFEFAWKRILDPSIRARSPEMIYAVEGARAYYQGESTNPNSVAVRAIAPYTLVVELVEPAAYFINLLTHPKLVPVPRHIVERYGEAWIDPDNLVTNGPFRLKEWQSGDRITLVPNPVYFGHYQGNLRQVDLLSDAEVPAEDQLAAYRAGRLGILQLRPNILYARNEHAEEYQQIDIGSTSYLGFSLTESSFHDHRVRQAFAHSIDREYLANDQLNGINLPATGGFLPPGFPGHSPDIGLPYDPERARQLLTEAGYPDGKGFPPQELLIQDRVRDKITAQTLQRYWAQYLGIQIHLKMMVWGDFINHWRHTPLFLLGWSADYPDPDSFLRVGVRRVASFWQHVGYDQLISNAACITDQVERLSLYRQADRILMEEAAIVPTFYNVGHYLVKSWVKNYIPSELHFKNVIIEPH